MNFRSSTGCVAALVASVLCGCATAGAPAVPSKAVNYADLNLNSPSGVATLYKRIKWTARYVCEKPQGVKELIVEADLRACEQDAVDRAVVQANLPSLSELHLARTGHQSGQYADRR